MHVPNDPPTGCCNPLTSLCTRILGSTKLDVNTDVRNHIYHLQTGTSYIPTKNTLKARAIMALTYLSIATLSLIGYIVYGLVLAIYRLYFSPLAKFPGSKIAAVSLWYEFYYDVIKKGRYSWRIGEMHEQYGPIIRINPYELHINDPDYLETLYVPTTTRRTQKYEWQMRAFGPTLSAFATSSHELHRLRRGALSPFFSRASVVGLAPTITSSISTLVARLERMRGTGSVVNLCDAFMALTNDVICGYAFASPQGFLEEPDFASEWGQTMKDLGSIRAACQHLGWLYGIMGRIPQSITRYVMTNPKMGAVGHLRRVVQSKIDDVKAGMAKGNKQEGRKTIFYDLLTNEHLSEMDKTDGRLVAEGMSVMMGGSNTVEHALTVMSYHLIKQRDIRERLQAELLEAQNGADAPLQWAQLEQLPYLSAVITEGLRCSLGVTARLARISPDIPLQYKDWTIPSGIPVAMSIPLIHWNPEIFPSPKSFQPERWLGPDSARLRKYMHSFGRGRGNVWE